MLYMRCGLKQAVPQRKTVTTPTSALMAVLSHDAMLVRRMLRHCVCPSVRPSVCHKWEMYPAYRTCGRVNEDSPAGGNWAECQLSRLAPAAAAATPRSAVPIPLSGLGGGRRASTGRCRSTTSAVDAGASPPPLGMAGRRRRGAAGGGLAGSMGTKHEDEAWAAGTAEQTGDEVTVCGRGGRSPPTTAAVCKYTTHTRAHTHTHSRQSVTDDCTHPRPSVAIPFPGAQYHQM